MVLATDNNGSFAESHADADVVVARPLRLLQLSEWNLDVFSSIDRRRRPVPQYPHWPSVADSLLLAAATIANEFVRTTWSVSSRRHLCPSSDQLTVGWPSFSRRTRRNNVVRRDLARRKRTDGKHLQLEIPGYEKQQHQQQDYHGGWPVAT